MFVGQEEEEEEEERERERERNETETIPTCAWWKASERQSTDDASARFYPIFELFVGLSTTQHKYG